MALLAIKILDGGAERLSVYLLVAIVCCAILFKGRMTNGVATRGSAPLYGCNMSFKDIFHNAGKNSKTCKDLERGYYEVRSYSKELDSFSRRTLLTPYPVFKAKQAILV